MNQYLKDRIKRFWLRIDHAAQEHGISQAWIEAIIAQESGGNPDATRQEPAIRDASYGLMQILYGTAKGLGYTGEPSGLLDPATNIELGAKLLAQLKVRFRDLELASAAYNCGPGRVASTPGQTFAEKRDKLPNITQAYVPNVMAMMKDFAADHEAAGGA